MKCTPDIIHAHRVSCTLFFLTKQASINETGAFTLTSFTSCIWGCTHSTINLQKKKQKNKRNTWYVEMWVLFCSLEIYK